jgi:sugar lactone lactonase YvrE
LTRPAAVAVDAAGQILVIDRPEPEAFRLLRFQADGSREDVVARLGRGRDDAELLDPAAVAVDAEGHVLILDAQTGSVRRFTADGRWLATLTAPEAAGPPLTNPRDLQVDAAGCLYIADTDNNRALKLSADGELLWQIERFTSEGDEQDLYEPSSVCVAADGTVYVADTNENRVVVFDRQARLKSVWNGDRFKFPACVRCSATGLVYVGDRGLERIRRFQSGGNASGTMLLGKAGADENQLTAGAFTAGADGEIVMLDPVRELVVLLSFPGE